MLTFSGTDANRAIVAFFGTHSAALPEHTREKLTEALVSTDLASTVITVMEALYAARADLDADGIELLGGLAGFVSDKGFHGKGVVAAQIAGVAARIADGGEAEAEGDPLLTRDLPRTDRPALPDYLLALASLPLAAEGEA